MRVPGLGRVMTLALTTCSTEGKMDIIAFTVTVLTLPRLQPTVPADFFFFFLLQPAFRHSSASLQPAISQPSAIPQPAFSHPSASLQPPTQCTEVSFTRLQPSPTCSNTIPTKTTTRFKISTARFSCKIQPQDPAARFKIQPQDSRFSRKIQDSAAASDS